MSGLSRSEMQSTSPPPPPPYSSKHTIIAAPPAVSNRSSPHLQPPLSPIGRGNKSPAPDPGLSGHRVSTALNITFSSPPPTDANRDTFFVDQTRRHTVQRVINPASPSSQLLNKTTNSSVNNAASGNNPTADWKPASASEQTQHHPVLLSRRSSAGGNAASSGGVSASIAASAPSLGICAECGGRITNIATACQALGCFYHDKCFVCCCCQRTLRGKTFYKDQDKIYCEEDYLYCGFQRTAEKCTACGHIIAQTILLQAMGKSYHPGCFRCTICNKCLDGEAFTVDVEGRIYCLYDFYLVTASTCAACANRILPVSPTDEVIRVVAMNKEFHVECYRCEDCNLLLSDEVSSRCYPYVETGDGGLPGRTHLLCLKCHLARIGATPAPGQNLEVLLQGRSSGGSQRRGSNGSASLTSSTLSCDMGTGGGLNSGGGGAAPSTPTYGSKSILTSPGGRSSPFSTERRVISKPWLQGGRSGYYGEGDGR